MSQKSQKSYTEEFKHRAIKLAIESDQSMSKTAENLGVSTSSLCKWVKESSLNATGSNSSKSDDSNLYEELKRLKKENARLKEEREILKKAAAYFASESK